MTQTREDVMRCKGVWKIFGDKSRQAMDAVRSQGLLKTDIREKVGCVVGLQNASFTAGAGSSA
jgi:glycine betaine/proline transport system ATP-binding protein